MPYIATGIGSDQDSSFPGPQSRRTNLSYLKLFVVDS